MKSYTLILLLLGSFVQVFSQHYVDKRGKKHLWGHTNVDAISSGEYEEWYHENAKDYNCKLTEGDAKYLEDVKVKIFIGTWCGDTKYLLPKFIKTWQLLGLSEDQLELIALHNEGDKYKQGPHRETFGYNIHRVPTFIFTRSDQEIGRIVERSVFDLDTDILQIAKGQPYEERYQGATLLNQYFEEFSKDTLLLESNFVEAMKKVRRELSSSGELNALGYVLMAQGETEKAEFTFRLNRYIHRYQPNVIDSYGEFLFKQGRYEAALDEYLEVIRLKGEDKNASKMIMDIYDELDKVAH